jgi:hypothetical protein
MIVAKAVGLLQYPLYLSFLSVSVDLTEAAWEKRFHPSLQSSHLHGLGHRRLTVEAMWPEFPGCPGWQAEGTLGMVLLSFQ